MNTIESLQFAAEMAAHNAGCIARTLAVGSAESDEAFARHKEGTA